MGFDAGFVQVNAAIFGRCRRGVEPVLTLNQFAIGNAALDGADAESRAKILVGLPDRDQVAGIDF